MPPNSQEAYNTHRNYITCAASLMSGASLSYRGPNLRRAGLPHVAQKQNLIRLTQQSLNDERRIVQIDQDYSYASTSWLPIKAYYLIFNALLSIEYVLTLQRASFSKGHSQTVDEFTDKLRAGTIQFSDPILNQVFDRSIINFRTPPGTNLSPRTPRDVMYKLIMKKIGKDKEKEWRRVRGIGRRTGARYNNYLANQFRVSIFDFPYFMRIRANYRDFAFIDGITTRETD